MSGRQRTLFQTWGSSLSRSSGAPGCSLPRERPRDPGVRSSQAPLSAAVEEAQPESDDEVLLVAAFEAEQRLRGENGGFCTSSGALWIYPTNCPVRDYQLRISQTALFCNTLVCLPTGLGKTFIAAVVMYNFYRWFPSGKVVFMAPTKPLVTQQIEACYQVMGIPQPHMAELTGSTQAVTRKEIWSSKRVLFLTPQVMVNDLTRGACPAADVKCVVVDEAHKALGNYAYCQVVRELLKYTHHFRILALSATPGSDVKAVQQVITNLLIGQIELRSEDSPDILPYSHERRVEKLVVPLGDELAAIQKTYIQILETFASSLIQRNVLMRRDIPNLTKYQIILARDQFRKNPSPNIVGLHQGIIEGEFAICISLYHGYELLQQMGMRSLYFFLCGIMDGTKGMTLAKNELSRNENFMKLYNRLECMFAHTHGTSASDNAFLHKGEKRKDFFYSHPKLKKLEEIVIEHFRSWNAKNTSEKKYDDTRVMIFSSFRDSVQEIAEMLLKHQPIIRVMTFVGHASGKSMKGFTQKEQLEVVKRFRDGGYNTLVSTCVGEEGLDIGEVDLIICFDAQKSPIRLIQRMGRTGRKRQGRIVVILAEGREERTYNQSQSNKRNIYKAISGSRQILHFYQGSPRMVPDDINPKLHKMFITHGVFAPEKASWRVQRKSSRDGMSHKNSRKDYFLTEEEFKTWNRLFRLKDSDEIKEITLPQVHFPSLQDEENRSTETPTAGVHQLSLSEWRVWQDHPLPTHQVDHSDRCQHYVSIMQMIEGMRHEEGECSYELEIKSYLQMEDVSSTFSIPRSEYFNLANNTTTAHKKSSLAQNINEDSLFSVMESDEECGEIVKQTHTQTTDSSSLKKISCKEMKKDEHKREKNDDMHVLDTDTNFSGETVSQADLPNGKRMLGSHSIAKTCTLNQPGVSSLDCQLINKATTSFVASFLDSGYSSFNDEKSVPPNLCLLSEEELFAMRTEEQFDIHYTFTEEVLANIDRFLSHSPPPLSELSDLEYDVAKSITLEDLHSLSYEEHSQNLKSASVMAHVLEDSQQNLELDSDKLSHPSVKSSFFGMTNHCNSNKSCSHDCDNIIRKNIKNGGMHVDAAKNFVDKKTCDADSNDCPESLSDHSLLLFEDDNEEFNGAHLSPRSGKGKSSCVSEEIPVGEMAQISHFLISDELLLSDDSDPQDQIIYDTNSWKSRENLKDIHVETPKDEHVFDCSRDLFSVTFDLGFHSPESDGEIVEHSSDRISNGLSDDVYRKTLDIQEIRNANYVPNQHGDCVENFPSGTVPTVAREDIPSPNFVRFPVKAAKCPEFMSPHSGKFSLPAGEKVMSTPLSESKALNSFSKIKKNILETLDFSNEKSVPQSFKNKLSLTFGDSEFSLEKTKSSEQNHLHSSYHYPAEGQLITTNSESDDEISLRKSKKPKRNVLKSPEDQKSSEGDSPVHAVKKRRVLVPELSSSDESENFHRSQLEDFKCNSNARKGIKGQKRQSHVKGLARMFLDDEAELSEEDSKCVSSDENESENEQDSSILDFLDDDTHFSQAVNDSEMRAVYMKSLHSPLMSNKYKMVHRKHNDMNIFSQIPEQDESYLEDSFCVAKVESCGSQSSGEEVCVDFSLIKEDSFAEGNKKYNTQRVRTRGSRLRSKKKLTRIVLPDDSSEEEKNEQGGNNGEGPCTVFQVHLGSDDLDVVPARPPSLPRGLPNAAGSLSPKQTQKMLLHLKDTSSEELGFKPQRHSKVKPSTSPGLAAESQKEGRQGPIWLKVGSTLEDPCTTQEFSVNSKPHVGDTLPSLRLPQEGKRTCILVNSREITSGLEVISSLRAIHGLQVEVCPLNGCDYIVSSRMVVERMSQSEMLNTANKNKLVKQIQHLHSMFERICVIVEKDKGKTGDTSRMFRRTKSYDSLLTALVGAGIRILFSCGQEETAYLLKELSSVEQRKKVGIHVPAVNTTKSDALQFYLSIPNISYITALNMCHQFSSVKKMANSSPQEISMYAQVPHQKAEEIYRYIHYIFDMQMLPKDINQDRLKSDE
ncbi:Fanconi anemia group M protein-like [Perognathus longimembris pacificus]|uniref:Fanconi anemia group M protein-like n=1 Tax=Perognathus longimembris pacificus TaxID=214514 RepID=UPI00201885ED|nr:Fanconi anemia group M protein-like [Perognathus longimembris pacificus]